MRKSGCIAVNGGINQNTADKSHLEYSFYGDSVALLAAMGPEYGSAKIYLDNKLYDTVSFNSEIWIERYSLLPRDIVLRGVYDGVDIDGITLDGLYPHGMGIMMEDCVYVPHSSTSIWYEGHWMRKSGCIAVNG